MKNYIKTGIIAVAAAFTLVACDDLDQMPKYGETSESIFATIDGYRAVNAKVLSSYSIVGKDKGGGADISLYTGHDLMRNLFMLQEGPTDECAFRWLSGDNLGSLAYMQWDATQANIADVYYELYHTITLANDFLRNAAKVPTGFTDAEKAEVGVMAAEVRFFRAMSYAWVLDLYGQGPFADENTPTANYIPERYDGAKLLAYIESELDGLDALLPDMPAYAHPGKGAVYALQSRVFLNAATTAGVDRYNDCIKVTKKLLAMNYELEPDFAKLFNGDNHKRTNEIILHFAVDGDNAMTWGTTTNLVQGSIGSDNNQDPTKYGVANGWGNYRLRGEYAEVFGDLDACADSRCMIFTDGQNQYLDAGIDDGKSGYHLEKWTNLTDDGEPACDSAHGVNTDYPAFRLAEAMLNCAEAVLRGGTEMSRSDARDLVNEVRRRAYGDNSGDITDAQFTLDFMLDERARELAYESLRRSDLRRHGKFTTGAYLWQWKGGVVSGREVNAKYNIYPIPSSEISANPKLSNPIY